MTAFVVTALIEAGVTENDGRIQNAMKCMEQQLDDVKDTYTLAVLAFALKMAGSSKTDQLLKRLDEKAVRDGQSFVILSSLPLSCALPLVEGLTFTFQLQDYLKEL